MDEVSNALWYLEDRLLEAEWRVRERLIQAFEDEFGCGLAAVTPLTMGSWVGGDRDGNPFVTAEITLAAARSARRAVLGHYGRALADLTARLSVSERLAAMSPELRASLERDRQELPGVWEQNRRRNADEPLRLNVSFMRARVEADAHAADRTARALGLEGEGGLVGPAREPDVCRIGSGPLCETLEDLAQGALVVRSLLGEPIWQRHLAARGRHQEVMLGYSDAAKDAGLFPSAWALYRVQEDVARACADAGVSWTLFHGRGGTVGRGGGSPVARALTALPPGTVHGGIKITEQGEIVSQNFGLLSVAERSLELMLSGVLLHRFEDWRDGLAPGEEAQFREVMDRLAAEALPCYRTLVYDSGDLFRLFLETTPVRELADVRFGSRPAYRAPGEETMEGIRAIPWVFGWTQTRLMLPGWLGVGTALEAVARGPGGLAGLRRMAPAWPFFADLLAKVEMVCAKAHLAIARMYVRELGGDLALFDHLENEFRRTIAALLRIRES